MSKFGQKYSLTSGGLLNVLFDKLKFFPNRQSSVRFKILFFVLTMGIPLIVLAKIQGGLYNPDIEIPLFDDYEALMRLFVALPIFFLADRKIDPVFNMFLDHMDDLIIGPDREKFDEMMRKLGKWINSVLPEILFLLSIYIKIYYDIETKKDVSNWFSTGQVPNVQISYAGWWFLLYCLPIFQLVMIRWFWRWFLCVYLLFRLSRLKITIYAAHGDEAGGLSFIVALPFSFNIISFVMGMIISSNIAVDILHRGETVDQNILLIIFYILIMIILFLGPLLFFGNILIQEKIKGVMSYTALINQHHEAFITKWKKEGHVDQDKLLGSPDVSSLADINGGYQAVKDMRLMLMTKKFFYRFVIMTAIPFVPLILTEYSTNEIYQKLLEKIMG